MLSLNISAANGSLTETVSAIASLDESVLTTLAEFLYTIQRAHGILWTMGNGGSSSTGSHLACDIGKGVGASIDSPMRALSVNEQAITQSAWANDFGFEEALCNQLKQLARRGDGVLAISGSGNSPNVIKAAEWAHDNGYPVAVMVGRGGGMLCDFADVQLRVDSSDMQVIENVHLVVVHWLYKALANVAASK